MTVFISGHILAEISKSAARIAIIHEGRLLQEMDSDRLVELQQRGLLLRSRDNPVARELPRAGTDERAQPLRNERAVGIRRPEVGRKALTLSICRA